MDNKQQFKEDDDPFDIWINMGVVVGGRTRHLEMLLTQIKHDENLKLVYTKTSGGKLEIVEKKEEHEP